MHILLHSMALYLALYTGHIEDIKEGVSARTNNAEDVVSVCISKEALHIACQQVYTFSLSSWL